MSEIGMSQARIDEIELRLVGVDHRPWVLSQPTGVDTNGRRYISKGSRKAAKKAIRDSAIPIKASPEADKQLRGWGHKDGQDHLYSTQGLINSLCLFTLGPETTIDTAEFVAHAPDDVEDLLREVKFLRERYRKCEIERDEMRKDMLSARVEANSLRERLAEQRTAINAFRKLLDGAK